MKLEELQIAVEREAEAREALEARLLKVEESQAQLSADSSDGTEVAELKDKITELKSKEHREAILSEFVHNLSEEQWLFIGEKLGYFDKLPQEKVAGAEVAEAEVEASISELEIVHKDETCLIAQGKVEGKGWDYYPDADVSKKLKE